MIEFQKVGVVYNNEVEALKNIDLVIKGPTITGIIGPNGSGKSTLLKAALGVVRASGKVMLDGIQANKALKRIAYVAQKSSIDLSFPITVRECVALGTLPSLGLFKRITREEWESVDKALEIVGLSEQSQRQISALSGGQFQRVLIARCLVQNAEYLFLDEPFVGVDMVSEDIIIKILKDLKSKGKTILIVHHDLNKVEGYFDQVVMLNREIIAAGKTAQVFTVPNLKRAYGENILVERGE
ncbi:metal ABC transporter ATP-binding protein [Liquorilactobacillus capillatus]|uniref:Manganese ABC transporter ATP-binding protein n=1 Tax=Liquorilactobacillus capillatus DSM 19910 TaxID=1423731 RepID=A0A0R1M7G9_9LACO|nr:metal ABC transporter ATP-binding protein [Liquorilactobacillus capillatus]KRL00299.1 manganese ABC transporter ATP-binding protein [Liquorilactobacillus capillatus DSM 19910]